MWRAEQIRSAGRVSPDPTGKSVRKRTWAAIRGRGFGRVMALRATLSRDHFSYVSTNRVRIRVQHRIDSLREIHYVSRASRALDQRLQRCTDPLQELVLIFVERFHGIAIAELRGISIEHAESFVEQLRTRVIQQLGPRRIGSGCRVASTASRRRPVDVLIVGFQGALPGVRLAGAGAPSLLSKA